MGTMASQITSLAIVYSIVYSSADQRKHQSSASLTFVRGIHRGPVNSPHKWPVTRKMFPFDDVIMLFIIIIAHPTPSNWNLTLMQHAFEHVGHIWPCLIYSINSPNMCDSIWKRYFGSTVYPKKYAHGFCFAVLCCGYTLTDFPISIRLTSLALWQSNDCPSASKATLMNMDKYYMWIHYERLHNHNKAKHN